MPIGGIARPNPSGGLSGAFPGMGYSTPPVNAQPSLANQYGVYNAAVQTQGADYGNIMKGYQDLYNKSANINPLQAPAPLNAQTYTPQSYNYSPSTDTRNSLNNLNQLSQTGGYSPQDIADLRARGVSPIRAVYANAQRGVDRSRALQGGYSPSYNAVTAKMAREMSDQVSSGVQNVNAGIAQNVAGNKLSASGTYASAAGNENALATSAGEQNAASANQAGQFNANARNTTNQFNTQMPLEYGRYNQANLGIQADALGGMRSLYGTTPAMSSLFGNQAMNAAQFQNELDQQNRRPFLNSIAGTIH